MRASAIAQVFLAAMSLTVTQLQASRQVSTAVQDVYFGASQGVGTSDTGVGTVVSPVADGDGFVYAFDAEQHMWIPIPISVGGKPTPDASYKYAVTAACMQTNPFSDAVCEAATTYCAANGQSGIHEDVWRREITPQQTGYSIVGELCTGALPNPVPPQQIADNAEEYERDHMPPGVPLVQPANVAIVNIPVLASVTPLPPQTMDVQLPVPGELVATASYKWTFDDGTAVAGPGTPYDGTDPRTNPTHYVAHTYTKAQTQASVSLTITWNATFTAAGQTITIPAVVMPPITTAFTVDEAHAVLVSG